MLSVLSVSRAVDTGTQSLHRLFLLCNTVQWTSDYVSPRLYPRRYWNAWRHWKPAQNISATRTSRCTWENTGRTKSTVLYFFYCLETIKECSTATHPRPSPTHHGSQLQAATDQAILTEQQQQRIRITIWLKVYVKGCISPNEKKKKTETFAERKHFFICILSLIFIIWININKLKQLWRVRQLITRELQKLLVYFVLPTQNNTKFQQSLSKETLIIKTPFINNLTHSAWNFALLVFGLPWFDRFSLK